jgi:hypothetical protein
MTEPSLDRWLVVKEAKSTGKEFYAAITGKPKFSQICRRHRNGSPIKVVKYKVGCGRLRGWREG